MTKPILSTKAKTLENLAPLLTCAHVLPQVTVACANKAAAKEVALKFGKDTPLIVRSSAAAEDSSTSSMAGAFTSVQNVIGEPELWRAIVEVFASYGSAHRDKDVVLIQPMITDVILSGVAFTHDPTTNSPYRIISLHRGPDTSFVTSGEGEIETWVVRAEHTDLDPEIAPIVALLDELETLIPDTPLDIEFAIDGEKKLVLLQARPLVINNSVSLANRKSHRALLDRIANRFNEAQGPHPYLCGNSTVFGVMPDWNPAEIIGRRPRPLSLSLYRDLITDRTWAYQRNNYGYRNLRSFPLLISLGGQPYIDVRLSFNSFIPADLNSAVADRLVDYYIERLIQAPKLHDKVEFEIVFSCYTLDLPERIKTLEGVGFSEKECRLLTGSLRRLTNGIINRDDGLWRNDAAKIETLRDRNTAIMSSDLGPVQRIYWLLEDCKRYGTLPFAGLARAGFVSVQMLRSLVAIGVFTEADNQAFLHAVDTVSGHFSRDLDRLDRSTFLQQYGHLRPGTYDITSPRYDAAADLYLGNRVRAVGRKGKTSFSLSLQQMREIRGLLERHELSVDVVELMQFMQVGIEMREYAKFVFTKNLSDALAIFSDWGQTLGFSADDLSFANIGVLADLNVSTDDPVDIIGSSIEKGRKQYAESQSLWLPSLITKSTDVHAFKIAKESPNFVTQECVAGPVVVFTGNTGSSIDLRGTIVLVPSADPGFDWLFSAGIGGLVTAYGGVNSHMAIRASELQLPAVIGAGEVLFQQWTQAKYLRLDCAGQRVERIA